MQFKELKIIPSILKALEKQGYTMPTPIQEQAIPAHPGQERSAGMRADRNGQDGGVCCADSAVAQQ